MRQVDGFIAAILVLGLAAVLAWSRAEEVVLTGATRIVDGDTLVMAGHRVRLVGMDAPEMDQVCTRDGRDYPCGVVARDALGVLLAGREPSCAIKGRDRYGRDLGRCSIAGIDLGGDLVRRGLAVAYGGYAMEETAARVAGAGLWAGTFARPDAWRRAHPREHVR